MRKLLFILLLSSAATAVAMEGGFEAWGEMRKAAKLVKTSLDFTDAQVNATKIAKYNIDNQRGVSGGSDCKSLGTAIGKMLAKIDFSKALSSIWG